MASNIQNRKIELEIERVCKIWRNSSNKSPSYDKLNSIFSLGRNHLYIYC